MILFRLLARKKDVDKDRLVVHRAIFAKHVMVFLLVCVWDMAETAFHSKQSKSKWQTLMWNSVTQTGWRLQVSFATWFHIPAGKSACSHGKAGSKLDCRQLQWLRRKRRMATEFVRPQVSWLSCLGSYAWTIQDISTQAKCRWRAKECIAINMRRPATELSARPYWAVKRLRAWWKLGPDTLNTSWDKLFSQSFELAAGNFYFDFNTSIVMKIVIFIVIDLHGSVTV